MGTNYLENGTFSKSILNEFSKCEREVAKDVLYTMQIEDTKEHDVVRYYGSNGDSFAVDFKRTERFIVG